MSTTKVFSDRRTLLLVAAAALIVVHGWSPTGWFGFLSYLVVTGGAAAFAWRFAWQRPAGERSPAAWLAFGISASALGDVIYSILALRAAGAPDVSIADVAYVASYVGVAVGVFRSISAGRPRRRSAFDDDGLIDMAVIGLVAFLVVWYQWAGPTFADTTTSLLTRSVWAAYPILDAALLALLVRTLTSRRLPRTTVWLLVGGVTCWLLSDVGYLELTESHLFIALLDAGWMVGALLLAAGVAPRPSPAATDADGDLRIGVGRLAVSFAALLAPGLLELWSFLAGRDPKPMMFALAMVGLVVLAFLRAVLLSGVARDTNRRLETSKRLYQRLAENSSDAVLLVAPDGEILNEATVMLTLLGYGGGTTTGRHLLERVAPADTARAQQLLDQAVTVPGATVADELRALRSDGALIWLSVRATNLIDDPAVGSLVVNLHDITKRKLAEAELEHRAFHDPLTGLANRALFRDRLDHALDRRGRTGLDPVVLYVDLDNFKHVNDSLGHEAGDELLRTVAGRIAALVRSGDTVARLGGDEFAVLLEPLADALEESAAIAERVIAALATPITAAHHQVHVAASLGVAVADATSTSSSLLRDADVAMYQAKHRGKNQWVRHEPAMHDAAVQRLQIATELSSAWVAEEFHLVYQPVVDLSTERIISFEALLRWEHPELGNVPPDVFIPVAEENGLIVPIGRWVLQTACRTVADWRRRNPTADFSIAVNLSGRQLSSPTLLDDVRGALAAAELDPSLLVLEMTETALIADPERAARVLRELRALGIKLAIDDFGTGYSSLSYLQQFPIDILKVDRSFVQTITETDTPAIVRGLLDLGHTLDLEIIAEGIESETQLRHLRAEHCGNGQGYLFSRPLEADAAEALLSAQPVVVAG